MAFWRWHVDEVFVRINGVQHYLWRAVDHEDQVLEVFASKRRNRKAALKFLRRAVKRYGSRKIYKQSLSTALAEWRLLAACAAALSDRTETF